VKKRKTSKRKINKFLYWTPRILGIVFVLFLMLFSLDVFQSNLTVGEIALALFMHNVPALILLMILIISWRHEIIGGIVFNLVGLLYILMLITDPNFHWYMLFWSLIISAPAFIVGILFFINWIKKNN